MTGLIVRADGGFIWLVVGVFWVIAQIAGAAGKKQQSLRPPGEPDDESGETPGDPFAELLRKMAGVQPFEVPKPEYEERLEERPWTPSLARRNGMNAEDIAALPDIEPLRREIMGQTDLPPDPSELPKIAIRPKMSAFRNSVPMIKLPAMNMSFRGSETSVRKVPNLGKILTPSDRSSLRRAMLGHIIFSPPKAME